MFKARIFLILSLVLAVHSLRLEQYDLIDPAEEEIEELFRLYLAYQAPFDIEPTFERFIFFRSQVLDIIAHNRDPTKTWKKTINQFTGLTLDELRGIAVMDPQQCSATNGVSAQGLVSIPDSYDWRALGVVSPVKNQGKCGSCWTFSTTGCLEANWAIYTGAPPPLLSEQQLVDCAGNFGNHGCEGGLPSQAFEYIRYAYGIETEAEYPYTATDGTCAFNQSKVGAVGAYVPFGSVNITEGDEQSLLEFVATKGPVSIAFEVTQDFMNYAGGVYVGSTCANDTQHVNHAVLAVGYGTDPKSNLDYWVVKNSWGAGWGEQGYFRIQRGVNMCGLAECASYPNITGTA